MSSVQVNADIRSYVVRKDGKKVLTRVDTTHIGKNISTKAVGSSRVNIVTNDYKFPEGSRSERATLLGESSHPHSLSLPPSLSPSLTPSLTHSLTHLTLSPADSRYFHLSARGRSETLQANHHHRLLHKTLYNGQFQLLGESHVRACLSYHTVRHLTHTHTHTTDVSVSPAGLYHLVAWQRQP